MLTLAAEGNFALFVLCTVLLFLLIISFVSFSSSLWGKILSALLNSFYNRNTRTFIIKIGRPLPPLNPPILLPLAL